MSDLNPIEASDDDALAQFDKYASKYKSSQWDGVTQPAQMRFREHYKDLSEALRLSRWLAIKLGIPVDLSIVNGAWSFSDEAQRAVERLYNSLNEERQEREDALKASEEHWSINENYYKEKLNEDAAWGRDSSGEPYGLPNK